MEDTYNVKRVHLPKRHDGTAIYNGALVVFIKITETWWKAMAYYDGLYAVGSGSTRERAFNWIKYELDKPHFKGDLFDVLNPLEMGHCPKCGKRYNWRDVIWHNSVDEDQEDVFCLDLWCSECGEEAYDFCSWGEVNSRKDAYEALQRREFTKLVEPAYRQRYGHPFDEYVD